MTISVPRPGRVERAGREGWLDTGGQSWVMSTSQRVSPLFRQMATQRAWGELIERLGRCPRPPHEVIVFGFSKLEWKLREVVRDLEDPPLEVLAVRLVRKYVPGERPPEVSVVHWWHAVRRPLVVETLTLRTGRGDRRHRSGCLTAVTTMHDGPGRRTVTGWPGTLVARRDIDAS